MTVITKITEKNINQ